MNRSVTAFSLAAVFLMLCPARAQSQKPLTRDEVSVFKKKLVALFESLGKPPAGYSVERESFNLPTDAYPGAGSASYSPVGAYATREYETGKGDRDASKNLEEEYEKKLLEAQAKGDYQAMARIAEEMQKKAGELSLKVHEGKKEPIHVSISLNGGAGATIDPDAVVHEQSGVIILKDLDVSPEKGRVTIYFDPVSLRETKQLSKVELRHPDGGVAKKTTVLHLTIELTGPSVEIETWAKKVEFRKALAQIDR